MSTDVVTYERPDHAAMVIETEGTLVCAKEIQITSPAMYDLAADELKSVKARAKELEKTRVAITKPLDDAKKLVMDLFRRPLELLGESEGVLKRGMLGYVEQQEALRRAEQDRLDAIAKAERERLAAEARAIEQEASRRAAEAKAEEDRIDNDLRIKQEAEAKAAADAVAAAKGAEAKEAAIKAQAEAAERAEQQRIAAQAEAAERAEQQRIAEENAREQAASLAMTAQVITAPVSHIAEVKSSGISTRESWKGRCDDKAALVKFVANNPQFLNLVDVNDSALNQLAKAMKGAMKVDGCTAYPERVMSSRAV